MKRSEFISDLAKYLVKKDQYLALNEVQAQELAKNVLKYCNSIEMLPPSRTRNLTEKEAQKLTDNVGVEFSVEDVQNEFTWEPENETK